MRLAATALTAVLALLLAGCLEMLDLSDEPSDDELTWVAQVYSGGRQCEPEESFSPPDIVELFEAQGVAVYDTHIIEHAECDGCSCPYYSASHFARIEFVNLEIAEELGFHVVESVPGT